MVEFEEGWDVYTHTVATALQMPPIWAICTRDLRLGPEAEMACGKVFHSCLSLSPWVSEQARAEGNIPHLQLQVFLEVALAEMEAGEEVEGGWCCCKEPKEWLAEQGTMHLKNKLVLKGDGNRWPKWCHHLISPSPFPQCDASPRHFFFHFSHYYIQHCSRWYFF